VHASSTGPRPLPCLAACVQVNGLRKRLRLGPAALQRQPEPASLTAVRHNLSITLSPRVAQMHWQQQDLQQVAITAGQPLPEQWSFQLLQEDGQQVPAAAYAGLAACLSPSGQALPQHQLLCSVQEDGWCRLQLQEGVSLTAAGDYDLRMVYREPRAELADLLPLGGTLHLPAMPRVGQAAACSTYDP
jgi:hypothetical protein